MDTESPITAWRRMIVCMVVSLYVAGCTNGASTSAPISRIGSGHFLTAAEQGANGNGSYNRNYNSIPKGSYSGNTYTVKRGDTLFYIAWITGSDFRELADRNSIARPYNLRPGQTLRLGDASAGMLTATDATSGGLPAPPSGRQMQTEQIDSPSINGYPGESNVAVRLNKKYFIVNKKTSGSVSDSAVNMAGSNGDRVNPWIWPTEGKIIDGFSAVEGGNKGIDIAAERGKLIVAAASGRVVYAGNALRGYGNLIIIKHNDDYLSAYAHNDTIQVREQQEVKAGEKIATMGGSGTGSVRLHFEIRYKGKSVNPLRYLPQR